MPIQPMLGFGPIPIARLRDITAAVRTVVEAMRVTIQAQTSRAQIGRSLVRTDLDERWGGSVHESVAVVREERL